MGPSHSVDRSTASHGRESVYFLLIIAGSFLLRLGLLIHLLSADPSQLLTNDSASYIDSARALVRTGVFSVSPELPDVPQTLRTPGYPLFIAAIYAVFGEDNGPVVFVQILLGVGTLALVYQVGRRQWGPQVALLATLLLAVDQISLAFSLKILAETLFTLLLFGMASVAAGLADAASPGRRSFLAGLLLALATMVRPISYYLILPAIVLLLLNGCSRQWPWKRVVGTCALLLLPFLLIVGGWQLRNYQRTGSAEFSTIQGRNMLLGRGGGIVASRDGISFDEAREQLRQEHPDESTWLRDGIRLVRSHPLLALRTHVIGGIKMLLGTGHPDLLGYVGVPVGEEGAIGDILRLAPRDYVRKWLIGAPLAFSVFSLLFLYILLIWAGVVLWLRREVILRRRSGWWDLWMWGVLLAIVLLSAEPEAYPRFRVPIMPILALYAARGIRSV